MEAQFRLQAPFRLSAQKGPEDVWGLWANLLNLSLAFAL